MKRPAVVMAAAAWSAVIDATAGPMGELVEQAAKLRPVGLRAARHFAEHLLSSGPGQLADLGLDALAVRRYPRVAVFHA
jgi:hypothetical protein